MRAGIELAKALKFQGNVENKRTLKIAELKKYIWIDHCDFTKIN